MTGFNDSVANGTPPMLWVHELAARLQEEPRDELFTDPGGISRSLSGAADLFDLPAVCASFDTTMEAEATGCDVTLGGDGPALESGCIETVDDAFDVDIDAVPTNGRMPVFIDATERLVETLSTTSVLGGVTGPGVLTDSLMVTDRSQADAETVEETLYTAGEIGAAVTTAVLDTGADGVALLEPEGTEASEEYADNLRPLLNVVDHYDASAVLVTERATVADVELAGEVGFDAITGAVEQREAALQAADDTGIRLGVGIPDERFLDGEDAVREFVEELPDGTLPTSEWTLPAETKPDVVHEVMGSLS